MDDQSEKKKEHQNTSCYNNGFQEQAEGQPSEQKVAIEIQRKFMQTEDCGL